MAVQGLDGGAGCDWGWYPADWSHEEIPVARPVTSRWRHGRLATLRASVGWVRKAHSTRTEGHSERLVTESSGRLRMPRLREPVARQAAFWMEVARASDPSGGRMAPSDMPAREWRRAMISGWRGHEK